MGRVKTFDKMAAERVMERIIFQYIIKWGSKELRGDIGYG